MLKEFRKSVDMKMHFGFKFLSLLTLSFFLSCTSQKEETPKLSSPTETSSATNSEGKGAFSGTVSYQGEIPAPKPIGMNADPMCARVYKDKEKPVIQEIQVGPDKGLANSFVYIKEGAPKGTPPATPVVLDQRGCIYIPHVLGIQVGQPLKILNSDQTLHNVNAMAKVNAPFNVGMSSTGQSVEKTFTKPEIMIRLKCDVHGWMSSYIGVVDHPHFAVTDTTGKFKFSHLGPGDYTLEAWHEKLGVTQIKAKIGPDQGQTDVEIQW